MFRYFLLVLTFFCVSSQLNGQSVTRMMRIGANGSSRFGESLQAVDVNKDNIPDLFVGAPASSGAAGLNAGAIFLINSPINESANPLNSRDSSLASGSAILEGSYADAFLGRTFRTGFFNGDSAADIAVLLAETTSRPATIALFFGPFTPGNRRTEPDVFISALMAFTNFGVSLDIIPGPAASFRDRLVVGSNFDGDRQEGAVYIFGDLSGERTLLSTVDAQLKIIGNESNSLFGSSVRFVGDINGDGAGDLVVSSPSSNRSGFKAGAMDVYFGPFTTTGSIPQESSGTVILGNVADRSWGSRLFAFGDVNSDGLSDFGFSSTREGALAYARGRRTWAPVVRIGSPTNATDTLVFFRIINSSQVDFGISADFSGDYNKDGIKDPIIGARGDSEGPRAGSAAFYALNGAPRAIFAAGAADQFSVQMRNMGNLSKNDQYGVDDIVVGSPKENVSAGFVYVYRGAINPPVLTFSVIPGSLIEINKPVKLSLEWTKGSRNIKEVRLVRNRSGIRDTLRFNSASVNKAEVEHTYATAVDITYTAEVIDDLNIKVGQSRSVIVGAFPEPFTLLTDPLNPLQIEGNRRNTFTFKWTPSVDTNGRVVQHQLYMASTAAALDRSAPATGRTFVGQTRGDSMSVNYGVLRNMLLVAGVSPGQQGTVFWSVWSNNGVFTRVAENAPKSFKANLGFLDNNLLLNGTLRSIRIDGLKADATSFSWGELETDLSSPIIRYELQFLSGPLNTSNVLFSKFSGSSGFLREIGITNEDFYNFLLSKNLLTQAQTDSARFYYTVRALINESTYWYANNGPKQLSIKYVRIRDLVANEQGMELPEALTVKQNFPNPFNPSTTIPFGIPSAGPVKMEVLNVLGQKVYTWKSSGNLTAGWHSHVLDASTWSSGVYFVRITTGAQIQVRKMTLVK